MEEASHAGETRFRTWFRPAAATGPHPGPPLAGLSLPVNGRGTNRGCAKGSSPSPFTGRGGPKGRGGVRCATVETLAAPSGTDTLGIFLSGEFLSRGLRGFAPVDFPARGGIG